MVPRDRRAFLVASSSLLVAGAVVGASLLAWPRFRHARELERLIRAIGAPADDEGENRGALREALLGYREPEALLALIEDFGRDESDRLPAPVRLSVELFAISPEPRDPRPRAALDALVGDRSAPLAKRLWAAYLLEELGSPTNAAEPPGFARKPTVSIAARNVSLAEALPPILEAAAMPVDTSAVATCDDAELHFEDTPWRALVRVASAIGGCRVVVEGGRVAVVPRRDCGCVSLKVEHRQAVVPCTQAWTLDVAPPAVLGVAPERNLDGTETPPLDSTDPEKVLRALARVNGLEVSRTGDRALRGKATAERLDLVRWIVDAARPRTERFRGTRDRADLLSALLEFDEPEAFLALIESFEAGWGVLHESTFSWDKRGPLPSLLEEWIELHATGAVDPRVVAAIDSLAGRGTPGQRFEALYLREELADPTFPRAPAALASAGRFDLELGTCTLPEAVASVVSASGARIRVDAGEAGDGSCLVCMSDTPWRLLVHLARASSSRLAVSGDTVRFVPRETLSAELARSDAPLAELEPKLGRAVVVAPPARLTLLPRAVAGVDALKVLRALAAMNGCVVREVDARTLELAAR